MSSLLSSLTPKFPLLLPPPLLAVGAIEVPLADIRGCVLTKVVAFCLHHIDDPFPLIEKVRVGGGGDTARHLFGVARPPPLPSLRAKLSPIDRISLCLPPPPV